MKKIKFLIPFLIIVAIIIFLGTSIVYKGTHLAKDLIEKDLPSIELYSQNNGRNVDIQSIKDDVYIINIFATWCEHCVKEKPLLKEIADKYNIPLYGVLNLDSIDNVDRETQEIFKDIFVDNDGILLSTLGSEGIPETLIIKDNQIIYNLRGSIDKKVVEKDLKSVLESLGK